MPGRSNADGGSLPMVTYEDGSTGQLYPDAFVQMAQARPAGQMPPEIMELLAMLNAGAQRRQAQPGPGAEALYGLFGGAPPAMSQPTPEPVPTPSTGTPFTDYLSQQRRM